MLHRSGSQLAWDVVELFVEHFVVCKIQEFPLGFSDLETTCCRRHHSKNLHHVASVDLSLCACASSNRFCIIRTKLQTKKGIF